jgi:hypothetical protein
VGTAHLGFKRYHKPVEGPIPKWHRVHSGTTYRATNSREATLTAPTGSENRIGLTSEVRDSL